MAHMRRIGATLLLCMVPVLCGAQDLTALGTDMAELLEALSGEIVPSLQATALLGSLSELRTRLRCEFQDAFCLVVLGFFATVIGVGSAVFVISGLYLSLVTASTPVLLTFLAMALITFLNTEREKRFLRNVFSHYLSGEVINELLEDPGKLDIGGEEKHMTAMFTDTRSFSGICEQLATQRLVRLLNSYLTEMANIIIDERGTIDKYEGDAIICFFGAPVSLSDSATRCRRPVRRAALGSRACRGRRGAHSSLRACGRAGTGRRRSHGGDSALPSGAVLLREQRVGGSGAALRGRTPEVPGGRFGSVLLGAVRNVPEGASAAVLGRSVQSCHQMSSPTVSWVSSGSHSRRYTFLTYRRMACINDAMNNALRSTFAVLFAVLLSLLLAPSLLWAQPQAEETRTITVVGEGSVEVAPNIATLQIGVESRAEQVEEALQTSRDAMDSILRVFQDEGIDDVDIQTSHYGIHLEHMPQGPGGPGGSGRDAVYRVSNMVSVTIRDLDRVAAIVDAAVKAGANQMWGIQFAVAEPEQYHDEAMALAMTDAEERAAYIAGLKDQAVGRLLSASEVVGGGPSPMSYRMEGFGGGAPGVRPGQLRFAARLQVVYELAN